MDIDVKGGLEDKYGEIGRRAVKKTQLALVPVCFLIAIVTYLDRSNLSFAAKDLERDLGLSNGQYGLAAGILFIGYAFFQIPSQLVIVRVGAPIWLAVLVFGWGAMEMITTVVKNPQQFYIMRFLLGSFEAGCFPGIWLHMTLFLTESEMSFAYALVTMAIPLSQVIGGPMAGGILYLDGKAGLHGWQWLFLLEGGLTVVYAIFIKLLLVTTPGKAWVLNPEERDWLEARQERIKTNAQGHNPVIGKWYGFLTVWRLWYLALMWFLVQCTVYGVLFFTPLIVDAMLSGDFGGNKPPVVYKGNAANWHTCKIAMISSILYVPAAFTMAITGYSSKQFQERNFHIAGCLTISGVAFMLVTTTINARGPISGFVVMIVAASFTLAVNGPLASWVAVILPSGSSGRATGFALFNAFGGVGGFAGPYIIGSLSEKAGRTSYTSSFILLGVFMCTAAVMALVLRTSSVEEAVRVVEPAEDAKVAAKDKKKKVVVVAPEEQEGA